MKTSNFNHDTLNTYHTTVLLEEAVEHLALKPGGTYLDATFGGGGHTRKILSTEPTCRVIALDWDKEAIQRNAPALEQEFGNRFIAEWGNFAHCYKLLKKHNITKLDGVLSDFGTSAFQIRHEDGFSFNKDTPLDMRMSKGHHYFNAAYIVNRFSQEQIADIIYKYGEDPLSRRIAAAIVAARTTGTKFETTKQLADLIQKLVPVRGYQRIHPATKTFQALRIFVNKELENIELFLKNVLPLVKQGGTIVCISFHSLEDRIVKDFFRNHPMELETITRKPITPHEEEVSRNRASRSAKLRAAKKR
ncbi:MAG: rRNA (cytosine1402-N4)-methyltransferase [Candidatus Dependentiae bacterium]|nr:rRNA (cytosine1402-N4)-methyltransferase [Candidatus Dependentiae bacterium]